MQLKHGSYEANPPFVPALLTATAQHVLAQLQHAEAAGGALSFVVLMPGWEEVQGWQALNSSPFLRKSLLVAAADHGEEKQTVGCDSSAMFAFVCHCSVNGPAQKGLRSMTLIIFCGM